MSEKTEFKMQTTPADFEVLASSFYTIVQEMGLVMERTARAPIYFSSHDFISALLTPDGDSISLAQYIPVLVGSTPFAVRAVKKFFGDDIHPGDIFMVNDPYTFDGGNHLQDWGVVYPVFYRDKLKFMICQKAHQQDNGGGVPGGYNPNAIDVWAEGLRIPPVRIFRDGKEIKDVLNLILTNVRIYETQRGDLLSMIGSARVGERRLLGLMDRYGEEMILTFLADIFNYSESRMRAEIAKIPDGTYRGETHGTSGAPPIIADITVKETDVVVDLRNCGLQQKEYINSPLSNTYSSVQIGLLTSLGKKIERQYRNAGCFRPVKILTTPGTIVHAVLPITQGHSTNFVAKQIIEVVWDALSKAIPHEVPGGWASINGWGFSGIDPRRNEGYGAPDFLGCANGAGAIWGTDGWPAAVNAISSGTCWTPEIEVVEALYPIFWERWELANDSGGPGKWRGGCGVHNVWLAESGQEPIYIAYQADPYIYETVPLIKGGQLPPPNSKRIIFADGKAATDEDTRRTKFYVLQSGDKAIDFSTGGAGVGNPLDRDTEATRDDVLNEFVSLQSAENDYGVVIDPETFEVDEELTQKLRYDKKNQR